MFVHLLLGFGIGVGTTLIGVSVWLRARSPRLQNWDDCCATADLIRSDPERAVKLLRRHLRAHPHDATALVLYAGTLLHVGREKELVDELAHRAREPESPPTLAMLLAKALVRLGRPTQASQFVRSALRDPKVAERIKMDPELSPSMAYA